LCKYLFLGCNRIVCIYAENSFDKPQNSSNYSLYYFEIKCKFEGELSDKWMYVGLRNLSSYVKYINYSAMNAKIKNEKGESFELSTFSFKNDDIFGCGLVYPPTDNLNEGEFPYVFFTQNGKQIGTKYLIKNF